MSKIFTTTLRLNLDNEEDRRAFQHLQNLDRKKYRSYSSAVIAAVNDYFTRQERLSEDPFLESRERQEAFLEEVKETIRVALRDSGAGLPSLAALLQASTQQRPLPENAPMSEENFDTAMDFINGL